MNSSYSREMTLNELTASLIRLIKPLYNAAPQTLYHSQKVSLCIPK